MNRIRILATLWVTKRAPVERAKWGPTRSESPEVAC